MKTVFNKLLGILIASSLFSSIHPDGIINTETVRMIHNAVELVETEFSQTLLKNPSEMFDQKKLKSLPDTLQNNYINYCIQMQAPASIKTKWLLEARQFGTSLKPILSKLPNLLLAITHELVDNVLPRHKEVFTKALEKESTEESDLLVGSYKEKVLSIIEYLKSVSTKTAPMNQKTDAVNTNSIKALTETLKQKLITPLFSNQSLLQKMKLKFGLSEYSDAINDASVVIEEKIAEHLTTKEIQTLNAFFQSETYKRIEEYGFAKIVATIFEALNEEYKSKITLIYEKITGKTLPLSE